MTRTLVLLTVFAACADSQTEAPVASPTGAPVEASGEPDPKSGPTSEPEPTSTPQSESIGSVKMEADGTLVLQLRAQSKDGAVGQGLFTYAPDHDRYPKVLAHVGPIGPGEEKAVPPWPDPSAPTTVYVVSKGGTEIGRLAIAAGTMGTLTLTAKDNDAAKALEERWGNVLSSGEITVRMHVPRGDGKRGGYGARIYKKGDAHWVEGVELLLRDRGFGVKVETLPGGG